jgi:hypothetical protein
MSPIKILFKTPGTVTALAAILGWLAKAGRMIVRSRATSDAHRKVRKMRRVRVLFVLLLISSTPVLRAQSTNATITGYMTDPSKAVVVDAKVAAISADANYFTVDGVSANFGVTGYTPLVQAARGALPALTASRGTSSLACVRVRCDVGLCHGHTKNREEALGSIQGIRSSLGEHYLPRTMGESGVQG